MNNDELRSFILDRLAPSLERAWQEHDTLAERTEASRQEAEREREARKKAEQKAADKDRAIADRDAEIDMLKKALADAKDTKATDNRNRFGSQSRKARHSADKASGRTDRREEKESHDSTAADGSSPATDCVDTTGEKGKVMTERELIARQARNGTRYSLSDAS